MDLNNLILDNTGNLPTSTTYWQLIGIQGATGLQGSTGVSATDENIIAYVIALS
jgi:hypothetical protein